MTRLYFQNVNGINLVSPGNWTDSCKHIHDMEVNIALLTEHKLDTQQPRVVRKLYEDARKMFGMSCFSINAVSTDLVSQLMYKPGGVLPLVNGGVKGQILTSDQDSFGHWPSTTYHHSSGPLLTIIVTYQVVAGDSGRAGPTTCATQQFSLYFLYTREGSPHPEDFRRHHANNLITFV